MICYASGGTLNLTQSALGNIQLASLRQFSLIHPLCNYQGTSTDIALLLHL